MTANSVRLGPGTLIFGTVATPLQDASCQLENGTVAWDKDADDPIRVLCGDTVAGNVTYTATLSGTFLQDLTEEDGLVAWSWATKGQSIDFTFIPNTAAGATVTGFVVVDPLDVGSDGDYGAVMESDFEWDIVGEPVLAWAGGAGVLEDAAVA